MSVIRDIVHYVVKPVLYSQLAAQVIAGIAMVLVELGR